MDKILKHLAVPDNVKTQIAPYLKELQEIPFPLKSVLADDEDFKIFIASNPCLSEVLYLGDDEEDSDGDDLGEITFSFLSTVYRVYNWLTEFSDEPLPSLETLDQYTAVVMLQKVVNDNNLSSINTAKDLLPELKGYLEYKNTPTTLGVGCGAAFIILLLCELNPHTFVHKDSTVKKENFDDQQTYRVDTEVISDASTSHDRSFDTLIQKIMAKDYTITFKLATEGNYLLTLTPTKQGNLPDNLSLFTEIADDITSQVISISVDKDHIYLTMGKIFN